MRDRQGAIVVAVLLALFVSLGILQYRWLREVADAQRARLAADAKARAAAIAQDFDREITRAFLMLPMDAEVARSRDVSAYAQRFEEYRQKAKWPDLVRDVLLYERNANGVVTLSRYSPQARSLEPTEWPPELRELGQALAGRSASALRGPIALDVPALLMPAAEPLSALAMPPKGTEKLLPVTVGKVIVRQQALDGANRQTLVILNRRVLAEQVLPDLIARHVGDARTSEYQASVLDSKGVPLIGPVASGAGDASAELMTLRFDEIDTAILKSFVPHVMSLAVRRENFAFRILHDTGVAGADQPPRWRLVLRHKLGSIERAVRGTLLRNMLLADTVFVLLAGSVALIVASARRERRLAARQLEFVASVSHELRTPLAVIRSAGENLADGVVNEAGQVRRYGGLVRDEGLRLSAMVEQVLSFAGAQAQAGDRRPLDFVAVVEKAIAAEAREGVSFERAIAPELPPVTGDAAALERAVANLLSNARKYGGPARRIQVQVGPRPDGMLALTVTDDGPGIEPDERERLFEPFFRGRRAREAQAPGSGLGLAIVRRIAEAHGGRVLVASEPGKGAAFTLLLPAAPRAAASAASDVQAHPAG
jgi:signal transduction histidine kinase